MQKHHCKAAFLSKGKSMTARDPMRASPPALPPACMPPTGWGCSAVSGRPAHRLTASLSLRYESRLQRQGRGARGRGFGRCSRLPRSLPGRQCRRRGSRGSRGRVGADAGAVPGTGSAQFPRRARQCSGPCFVPGGGREALRDPSWPAAPGTGRKGNGENSSPSLTKENDFWGRPLPPPLSSAK